jgi:hypothetical protein
MLEPRRRDGPRICPTAAGSGLRPGGNGPVRVLESTEPSPEDAVKTVVPTLGKNEDQFVGYVEGQFEA